ncbi:MAG TPA: glutathione S-transferase [Hyphomicrobiaceae bacterium]|nr:glutathione S-transferase [Hyphomicrobiaceae bacterium]
MKLLSSPLSPYGRKVKMTALMKGVMGDIELVPADTNKGDNTLNAQNPLGKIPCLIPAGGSAIYDSHVICEYLDSLKPAPALFPKSGTERWKTLTMGALGDGILDAALLLVYEKRFRPETMLVQAWVDRQQAKIDRALGQLEKAPPAYGNSPDYGHVTIAAALGYLDFRHEGKWRKSHPKLVAWLDGFAKVVPAFGETKPVA